MRRLFVLDKVDPIRWNRRIAALGGPMQLTSEWASFVCAKDNVQSLFIESSQDDDSFAAIVYLTRARVWPYSIWPSAVCDCIPLAKDRVSAIAEIEVLLHSLKVCEFTLNSFAYDGDVPIALAPLGYTEISRSEFELVLGKDIVATWSGFRPTLRNDIRRFERSEAVCHSPTDSGIVSKLLCIEQATTDRHRLQGKLGIPMREATYLALWDTLVKSGRAHVYIAEKDGLSIASAVVGVCGLKAYYLYGGATREGLVLNAPKGLLWYAIQQEFEAGIHKFNLGGMSASAAQADSLDHGLYKFKSGFGAVERACISGRKTLRPKLVATKAHLSAIVHRVREVFNNQ